MDYSSLYCLLSATRSDAIAIEHVSFYTHCTLTVPMRMATGLNTCRIDKKRIESMNPHARTRGSRDHVSWRARANWY